MPDTPETIPGIDDASKPSSKASYADLFLRLLDGVFLIDPETFMILEHNDSALRLFDIELPSVVGTEFNDFAFQEIRGDLQKKLRISRRRYYPVEFEGKFRSASGRELIAHLSMCPLKIGDTQELIQIVAQDVTKIREDEAKLAKYVGEIETLNEKLASLSITDELTTLNNVRRFKEVLAIEHERAARYGSTYSIIFLDADNFKHYNDRNGHPAGDVLLKGLAALFKTQVRGTDTLARYGGEEFVVLCPEVGVEGAAVVAERMRTAVCTQTFPHAEAQPLGCVSISIGVASFPADGKTAEEILKAADEGVYHSKKSGRNRVTTATQLKTTATATS